MRPITTCGLFVVLLTRGLLFEGTSAVADELSPAAKLFAPTNLVAWCIVPFDANKRGPAERAEMVKRLGLSRVAYDWRDEHVATFRARNRAVQKARHRVLRFLELARRDRTVDQETRHQAANLGDASLTHRWRPSREGCGGCQVDAADGRKDSRVGIETRNL